LNMSETRTQVWYVELDAREKPIRFYTMYLYTNMEHVGATHIALNAGLIRGQEDIETRVPGITCGSLRDFLHYFKEPDEVEKRAVE
ncbi:hypothetical protein, partial [Staphylococcus aureus]